MSSSTLPPSALPATDPPLRHSSPRSSLRKASRILRASKPWKWPSTRSTGAIAPMHTSCGASASAFPPQHQTRHYPHTSRTVERRPSWRSRRRTMMAEVAGKCRLPRLVHRGRLDWGIRSRARGRRRRRGHRLPRGMGSRIKGGPGRRGTPRGQSRRSPGRGCRSRRRGNLRGSRRPTARYSSL